MKLVICLLVIVSAASASVAEPVPTETLRICSENSQYWSSNLTREELLIELGKRKADVWTTFHVLERAENKQEELINGYTVQDFLDLNTFTPEDCTLATLRKRAKLYGDIAKENKGFDNSAAEGNLRQFASGIVGRIAEKCIEMAGEGGLNKPWPVDAIRDIKIYRSDFDFVHFILENE